LASVPNSDRVIVVGAGFAGLGMGIRLKKAGIHDFVILEQAHEVGGTWRDNHYPGAACDVESYLYSFSFEPNPGWTRTFATQREILDYLVGCTEKYGLRPHIRFGTGVVRARFDESERRWSVETTTSETFTGRVLVSGCGGLSRPCDPDVPGLACFRGPAFHSARWDPTASLEGRSVAVIGTGASAVQIVPEVAPRAAQLYVFQRTPPWILPKPDREIPPWRRAFFRRFPLAQRLARALIYWRREAVGLGFVVEPRILKTLGEAEGRRFLGRSVRDVSLRDKLLPTYAMGCKRILPTNDYYPAIQRPNVEVVTDPIREVQAHAIVTRDGAERPVDVIVLATGFDAAEPCAPFEIHGRGGARLDEVWRDGASAYLGTTVTGFPNLFLIIGPNTGLGHTSLVYMIESQVRYVVDAVRTMRARGWTAVDVRPETQARYNDRLQARLAKTVWASGCRSWYLTRSGRNTTLWPGLTFEYALRTRRFDPRAYVTT
jgi:cation diffusion facilitator CzcD-associated flavoprotein CzcO